MKVLPLKEGSYGWKPTREEVNGFLREQVLCVLSTLDEDGAPHGSTVAFSVTKDDRFLIGTSTKSDKRRNIDGDERVAMTVTDAERRFTVQLSGVARVLDDDDFNATFAEEHYRQRPQSLPFRDVPGQCHILVSPHYIRFSDCNPHPWVITEFSYE